MAARRNLPAEPFWLVPGAAAAAAAAKIPPVIMQVPAVGQMQQGGPEAALQLTDAPGEYCLPPLATLPRTSMAADFILHLYASFLIHNTPLERSNSLAMANAAMCMISNSLHANAGCKILSSVEMATLTSLD